MFTNSVMINVKLRSQFKSSVRPPPLTPLSILRWYMKGFGSCNYCVNIHWAVNCFHMLPYLAWVLATVEWLCTTVQYSYLLNWAYKQEVLLRCFIASISSAE